jgi:hypothetical protein
MRQIAPLASPSRPELTVADFFLSSPGRFLPLFHCSTVRLPPLPYNWSRWFDASGRTVADVFALGRFTLLLMTPVTIASRMPATPPPERL